MQQQQQQSQHNLRQSLQQQLLRKSQGDEALLAYQAGGLQGVVGGSTICGPSASIQLPQQPRNFMDITQQPQVASQVQDEGQGKGQNQIHAQAYLHYALQAAQHKIRANIPSQQQQSKGGLSGPTVADPDQFNNLKLQELMRIQAASQAQASMFKKTPGQLAQIEKQMEQGQPSSDLRSEMKSQQAQMAQLSGNMGRPGQGLPNQHPMQNLSNNQYPNFAHLQALQAWAMDKNIDISSPANAHLVPQLLLQFQARLVAMQKASDGNHAAHQTHMLPAKSHIVSSSSVQDYAGPSNGNVLHGNSILKGHAVQGGLYSKPRPAVTTGIVPASGYPAMSNPTSVQTQHPIAQGGDYQIDRADRHQNSSASVAAMHGLSSSATAATQMGDPSAAKNMQVSPESLQMQYYRQFQSNRPSLHSAGANEVSTSNHLANPQVNHSVPVQHQQYGFTRQQLHVLKAQIMAFRRLKRGEGSLPPDVIRAIIPPPLYSQQGQVGPEATPNEKAFGQQAVDQPRVVESNDRVQQFVPPNKGQIVLKEERDVNESSPMVEERKPVLNTFPGMPIAGKEGSPMVVSVKEEKNNKVLVKIEQEAEQVTQAKASATNDMTLETSKVVTSKSPPPDISAQIKKHPVGNSGQLSKDMNIIRKYHGPLYDFPPFGKKSNPLLPTTLHPGNGGTSLSIGYDVKDLLFEEGMDVLNKKRTESLKKIERLLAVKLDRKRIRPDLVLKLQIEERKLRLLDLQARVRDEVDQQQQEIMAMSDRPYRKFVRLCERQRADLARQVQLSQKAIKERQLKAVFQWRKRFLEAHWAIRDARSARNKGVAKYHEKMLKEFSKRKDEDRNKRMDALKNNDVDRYRQMLLEQQNQIPGDAQERYLVLSSFLSQTEEYLHKLGGKITAVKNNQEVEEAEMTAAAAARAQGLSEEEAAAAAACAAQEVVTRNKFSEMSASRNNMSVNKYYNLAHAVNEKIIRQPSMLRAGTLRDYQLVGLQWMLSLYNNKLNGILADEMGLGKTVQVMALIAYLMEFKGNYGPHLIIVPNAVMVNWKSELHNWLPTLSCIYYVGGKDQRTKLYTQEVSAMKFNVLVTTYEFIMRDRAKLSKVDWKYIIIDEAQRMKDRDSRLSRDLDKFKCQRRLLLTGTPLQNDLQELWSLLNLLLPEVFDNRKAFHDWFSKPFQKDGPSSQSPEDDWLETEKKVIIIHRLHQILEPFMLRRRVEDVEGSLPQKVSVVLKCKMSALQGAIYDWIKATGSIRLDPQTEARRIAGNSKRQIRAYVPLQNRCMELRKVCNHPLLSYPYRMEYSNDYVVRSCGKLWVLDRILVKLHKAGHRVLLFSTMTKLLDILEDYLQWRRLHYRRIDGTTSLEDRESAIHDFNKPGSECFLFLLSIRAAGRGLNLQSADTVVIYDPDPNPKNEEQAVARAHRIGQKREVRVIYLEAVVETISSYQKEDELRIGGTIDNEDDLAGKDRYMGSVESLVRNNIQQYKIDMADEVINAGRFDQRTTQEERRMTLETLLHDEERYQETVHNVPSMQEVNRLIARSKEELELFDRMDEEIEWPGEMMKHRQIPKWLRVGSREVNAATDSMSKQSLSRGFVVPIGSKEEEDKLCAMPPIITPEKKSADIENSSSRKLPKASSSNQKLLSNRQRGMRSVDEVDEEIEVSMDEKDGSSTHEEEGEIKEDLEDEENSRAADPVLNDRVQSEEGQLESDGGEDEETRATEVIENVVRGANEGEAASSESSFQNGKVNVGQASSPTVSAQKFGSLAALEAKPATQPKPMVEELEEGEIVASGDSHMEFQQSGSWVHEREDGEEEQVLQPKTKRKRSMRTRPRLPSEKLEEKPIPEKRVPPPVTFHQQGSNQTCYDYGRHAGPHKDVGAVSDAAYDKPDHWGANVKRRQVIQSRVEDSLLETLPVSKQRVLLKHNRSNGYIEPFQDATEYPRERWDPKIIHSGVSSSCIGGGHMSDITQKKCKNVFTRLQGTVNKDGRQIFFMELPKRNENPSYYRLVGNPIDARTIEQRLDHFEYGSVLDFSADVQLMLENATRYYSHSPHSPEVKAEARRLQSYFFQRMVHSFPDVDFSSVKTRSLVALGQTANSSTSSPKQQPNQSRLLKPQDDAILASDSVPAKHLPRTFNAVDDDVREKATQKENISKMQKEARVMFGDRSQIRERCRGDEVDKVTHPGDLVICKKKRKDRDKVIAKARMVNSAPDICQGARGLSQKDILISGQARQVQGWPQFASAERTGTSGLDTEKDVAQWARPVKRLRTDKRRPSHI